MKLSLRRTLVQLDWILSKSRLSHDIKCIVLIRNIKKILLQKYSAGNNYYLSKKLGYYSKKSKCKTVYIFIGNRIIYFAPVQFNYSFYNRKAKTKSLFILSILPPEKRKKHFFNFIGFHYLPFVFEVQNYF